MTTKRTFKLETATDDRRMTVGELRQFLLTLEDVDDETPVRVQISLSGWARRIEAVEA